MNTVRIIIAGGREFDDYDFLCRSMEGIKMIHGKDEIQIISGNARGADRLGERWAEAHELTPHLMPADWDRYKNKAGIVRNEEMAAVSQVLVAFWDGHSRGTKHMIGAALRGGLEVHIFRYRAESTADLFDY